MKRFYKFLMPLVAIVAMALPAGVSAQTTCTIKIVGEDAYGDGWNDGSLAVVQSGQTVATFDAYYTDNGGNGPVRDSTTVTVQSGVPVTFVWTVGGYDDEVSIWIYAADGTLLYSVVEPEAGTIFGMSNACATTFCPPPTGFAAASSGDTATFSWTAGSQTAWQLVWGPIGFNPDDESVYPTSVVTNSYEATGLTDGFYDAYLRTDCDGDYSYWVGPVQFGVGSTIVSLASGTDTLRSCNAIIVDDGGLSGNYTNDFDGTIVIYPSDNLHALQLTGFSYTEGKWDYLTITDNDGTILFCDNTPGDDSRHNFGPFNSLGPVTVSFHSDGSNTFDGFQVNVACMDLPDCIIPETFVLGDVDSTSVSFHWTDNSGTAWAIGYGPAGFTLGDTNTLWADFSDTLGTVSGLTPNTLYDFYLMAVCGADSSWTRSLTARTSCGEITTLPWVEDFSNCPAGSSVQFDQCWAIYNTYSTSSFYPYVSTSSGNKYLYMYFYGNGSTPGAGEKWGYAVMPSFSSDIMQMDLELSFDCWKSSTASYGSGVIVALFDTLTTSTVPSFDTVAVILPTATSMSSAQTYYVSLVGHELTGKRIGFFYQNQNPAATSNYNYYTYIDNVNLHEAPTCLVPTNLVANHITSDTLDLSWQGTAGSYWVEYRQSGAASGEEWTGVEVSDTTVILEPLSPNTQYDVRVYSLCGGDTSFSINGSFRTNCGAIVTLPWLEDFNSMSTTSSTTQIPCWDYIGATGYVNISSSYSHTGNCVRFYPNSSSSTDHVLELPVFDAAISGLELSFWTRPEGSSSGSLSVGYVTDPTQANSFVEVLNIPSSVGTTVTQYDVTFANAPEGSRIAMRHNVGSTAWYWFIDDIDVHAAPTCARPDSLTFDGGTATTADFSWVGSADSYDYEVYYGNTLVTSGSTTDTYVTISGLTIDNDYTFRLRSICGSSDSSNWISVNVHLGYCVPNFTSVDNNGISSVTFGVDGLEVTNTQRPTSSPYYGNYTAVIGGAVAGDTMPLSITYATGYTYGTIVWVDWNNNMVFEGSEVVHFGTSLSSNPTVYDASFMVPEDVDTGSYRMRIVGADSYYDSYVASAAAVAAANPCPTSSYAVAHDYTIHVGGAVSCRRPTELTLTSATLNSLTFGWTANNAETSWEITIGDNAPVVTSSNPYTATGLASSTTYAVTIRAICAPGDTSRPVTVNMATLCEEISLPMFYDFEEYTLLESVNCWNVLTTNTFTYDGNTQPIPAAWTNTEYGHNGLVTVMFNPRNGNPDMVTTPVINHPGNAINVRFWTMGYMFGGSGTFEVGVMTNPTDTSTFVVLHTLTAADTTMAEHEFNTTSLTTTGHVCLAFRATTTTSGAYLCIDDVTIEPYTTCGRPDNTQVSNITISTATLSWDAPTSGTPTGYEIVYGADGNMDTVTVAGTATSTVLTNLVMGSHYVASIRTLCSTNESSGWRDFPGFITECDVMTLPRTYNFDNFALLEQVDCWTSPTNNTYTRNSVAYPTPAVWVYNLYSHSGDGSLFFCPTTANGADIYVSPEVDHAGNDISVSFWTKGFLEGTVGTFEGGVMTDPDDTTTFVSLFTLSDTVTTMAQFTFNTTSLTSNAHVYIAFRATRPSTAAGSASFFTLDDLTITTSGGAPTTYSVSAVSADATMGSATVTPSGSVAAGTSVTATATANAGFQFLNWTVNGNVVSSANPYTFTVSANTALVANFEAEPVPDCDVPTAVTVSSVTLSSAIVSWNAAEGQSEWDVHVVGPNFDQTFTTTTNPYTVTGLTSATSYTVTVRANCSASAHSDWSTPQTFTTTTCQPVTGVTVSNITETTATVSWTAPAGVTSFEVEYGLNGFAHGVGQTVIANTNSITLSGLEHSTAYDVYVRSICAEGVYSEFATTPGTPNAPSFITTQVGIDDVDNSAVALYPNPATTSVTLSGIAGQATVSIVDMNGRVKEEYSVSANTLTIDLTGYAQGAYFVRITGEQQTAIRKLIVK